MVIVGWAAPERGGSPETGPAGVVTFLLPPVSSTTTTMGSAPPIAGVAAALSAERPRPTEEAGATLTDWMMGARFCGR